MNQTGHLKYRSSPVSGVSSAFSTQRERILINCNVHRESSDGVECSLYAPLHQRIFTTASSSTSSSSSSSSSRSAFPGVLKVGLGVPSCERIDFMDIGNSLEPDSGAGTMPKIEILGLDSPSEHMHLSRMGALQKSQSESSDSLDGLFIGKKDEIVADGHPKEEPDVFDVDNDDRRASLLMMNFSLDEVNFAMDKLGEDAPISELVDFIFAAQIAENQVHDNPNHGNGERNKESTTESLFGTMDKTLRLLELGFSENQISAAIEKYGTEVPITELADAICADEVGDTCSAANKRLLTSFNRNRSWTSGMEDGPSNHSFDPFTVKTEEFCLDAGSQFSDIDLEKYKGKRPKEEYIDELSSLKRPKQEYNDDLSNYLGPTCAEPRKGVQMPVHRREVHRKARRLDGFEMLESSKPKSCKSVDKMVAKPPYFFYGNVMNLSHDSWMKISQFLYATEPEYVDTQFFSALSRKEGYIHNLPPGNRFHILPKPPTTIQEVIPHAKRWWPSWDTRKQLSCISTETTGISQLCDRLGKIVATSKGLLSVEQQRDILHQCKTSNLVWVGRNKLAPIEPEYIEKILGYPINHTRVAELSLQERLQLLKHCFQTDTLGYHLSVLKSLFPGGLSVLSIYSGFGGAEITLQRLGICLKGVVSVEPSEMKQKILKKWWQSAGQMGELVQIENIQKLTSSKVESLVQKFGGFDLIICQNPYNYYSKKPTMAVDSGGLGGLDFSLFYEFVRVLQRFVDDRRELSFQNFKTIFLKLITDVLRWSDDCPTIMPAKFGLRTQLIKMRKKKFMN
ncbi:hypothetical protein HYC85_012770 [Camellia sinensis]|uniref:SAM-dependent MTase DRM-type domain-containing protein n=1 Tax=Camellia sinensis TaxID=4442 RepID=A0A7J7HE21_CAMSI|nr:hypothetical protein HYC85_012770 [Camellia sinensis]